MKVKVLGTRGEIEPSSPEHSRHSGVLVDGKLLLDLGEKEFLDLKPECVLITHLHPDHAFFITERLPETDVRIFAPEMKTGVSDVSRPEVAFEISGYKITPIPTHHSKLAKSNAYLVDDGKDKLLYTGDIVWMDKEFHHHLTNLNLVISDGSYMRRGGMIRKDKETGILYGHNGIPDLLRLFGPFSHNFLFVHFGGWFFKDITAANEKLEDLGRDVGKNVLVGFDGLELDLIDLAH